MPRAMIHMKKNILIPNWENIITYYDTLKGLSVSESEEIAKELLDNLPILEGIPRISRRNSKGEILPYREIQSKRNGCRQKPPQGDDEILTKTGKPRRYEEYLAMEFFKRHNVESNNPNSLFGLVLDYQTPLGGNQSYLSDDIRVKNISFNKRNIDLISYDEEKDYVYILELKRPTSGEPLISSVLEGYTYLKMLNREDFVQNMNTIYPKLRISINSSFVSAPLLYSGCDAAKQYEEIDEYPYLKRLLNALEIVPIIISEV